MHTVNTHMCTLSGCGKAGRISVLFFVRGGGGWGGCGALAGQEVCGGGTDKGVWGPGGSRQPTGRTDRQDAVDRICDPRGFYSLTVRSSNTTLPTSLWGNIIS